MPTSNGGDDRVCLCTLACAVASLYLQMPCSLTASAGWLNTAASVPITSDVNTQTHERVRRYLSTSSAYQFRVKRQTVKLMRKREDIVRIVTRSHSCKGDQTSSLVPPLKNGGTSGCCGGGGGGSGGGVGGGGGVINENRPYSSTR